MIHTSIFPLYDLASSFGNCVLEGKDVGKTKENGIVWTPRSIFRPPASYNVVMARAIIFASRIAPFVAFDIAVISFPSKYKTRFVGFNLRLTFRTTVPVRVFPATIAAS